MKLILLASAVIAFGMVSPIPVLDRWQAHFRQQMLASVAPYLSSNPQSEQERSLLREVCALPDSLPSPEL